MGVVPKILSLLALPSWAAVLGTQGACAVCDAVWPIRQRSLWSHCGSPGHQRMLSKLKASWATIQECLTAARAAGLGQVAEEQLEHAPIHNSILPPAGFVDAACTSVST